jgi:hypothetical protein
MNLCRESSTSESRAARSDVHPSDGELEAAHNACRRISSISSKELIAEPGQQRRDGKAGGDELRQDSPLSPFERHDGSDFYSGSLVRFEPQLVNVS